MKNKTEDINDKYGDQKYSKRIICTNCNYTGMIRIPMGIKVVDFKCTVCGCLSLKQTVE